MSRVTKAFSCAACCAALAVSFESCDAGDGPPICGCGEDGPATVRIACDAIGMPYVTVTGPCTVQYLGGEILLTGATTGQCQLAIALPDGGVSTVTVSFAEQWEPCGSDPHGCGQTTAATPEEVSVNQCGGAAADSGADAEVPDGPSESGSPD
jgi:hypothetical protein